MCCWKLESHANRWLLAGAVWNMLGVTSLGRMVSQMAHPLLPVHVTASALPGAGEWLGLSMFWPHFVQQPLPRHRPCALVTSA